MSTIVNELVALEKVACAHCGMTFAVPVEWLNERRRDKAHFCCPSGHGLSFKTSTEEQLRATIEFEKSRVKWAQDERDRAKRELEHQKFKTMGERSAKVRLQRRIANGVCPCCQRSFKNLRGHMAHMHPDFTTEPK